MYVFNGEEKLQIYVEVAYWFLGSKIKESMSSLSLKFRNVRKCDFLNNFLAIKDVSVTKILEMLYLSYPKI
jgi:hypothetical protein